MVPTRSPYSKSASSSCLLAAFPRWILRARSTFSWILARTFSLRCRGSTPASVVFPLPLMDFGLFQWSGPKLSRRRWASVVRKRLLHVIIVALNFLHNGPVAWRLLVLHLWSPITTYEAGFGDLHEEDSVQVVGEVKTEKKTSEALISPEAPYHFFGCCLSQA